MKDIFSTLHGAIQENPRDILIQPVPHTHHALAYINISARKHLSMMQIREYFVDQIFSACIRTESWDIVPIRFRVKRIEQIDHTFCLFLELAEEFAEEDKQILDALFIFAGSENTLEPEKDDWSEGSALWCMYIIGVRIHSADMPMRPFENRDHYVYFSNNGYAPYTGALVGDEFEIIPTIVPKNRLQSIRAITKELEEHTASLGEVPESSTIDAIMSVTSEKDGDVDSDIEKAIASVDDMFADFCQNDEISLPERATA